MVSVPYSGLIFLFTQKFVLLKKIPQSFRPLLGAYFFINCAIMNTSNERVSVPYSGLIFLCLRKC